MLGSTFLLAMVVAVPKPATTTVDRQHVTGRPPFPRLHIGGVVARPPDFPWDTNRLHVTGQERFPRAHVGGLPQPVKRAWVNPSPAADLVYGKRVVAKPTPPPTRTAPLARVVIVGDFPTQYQGLRVWNGTVVELCLVDIADAPDSPLRISKNGTTYAVYLVDTTDPDASPVRINTPVGVRAIRKAT